MRLEKAEQLLQLAEQMQASSEGVSLADIQDQFEVGRRTAERMRDAVIRLFPNVEERVQDDKTKRWRLRSGSLGHLTHLNADDLSELKTAIDQMRRENLPVQADNLERLWVKLKGMVRPESASRIETDLEALLEAEGHAMRPGPRPKIEPKVLYLLREAIKGSQKVLITYRGRVKGDIRERIVCPYGFLYGARHYLIAWCDDAQDIRTFALANIQEISLTDDFFVRHDDFDLKAYSERSFGVYQEDPFKAVWKFDAEVADDVRDHLFHPTQVLEDQPDGSIIVSFEAAGWKEMCWHLFTWDGSVEIVEPIKLKEQYTELTHRVMKRLGIEAGS